VPICESCGKLTRQPNILLSMVRLACDLCPRRGQHRKDTLIARFGGDVPDVRHLVAQCPRKDAPGAARGVY
jgi:hypothetical protein